MESVSASCESKNEKLKFVKTSTYKHEDRKIIQELVEKGLKGTTGSVDERITCLSLYNHRFFIREEGEQVNESDSSLSFSQKCGF